MRRALTCITVGGTLRRPSQPPAKRWTRDIPVYQRAIGTIDRGAFVAEIVPSKIKGLDDALVEFSRRRDPDAKPGLEKLASLKVLHPEIDAFSHHRRQQQRNQ